MRRCLRELWAEYPAILVSRQCSRVSGFRGVICLVIPSVSQYSRLHTIERPERWIGEPFRWIGAGASGAERRSRWSGVESSDAIVGKYLRAFYILRDL